MPRTYKINCARCHKRKSVASNPGATRKYCDDCDVVVKREQARERMREYRKRNKPAPAKRQEPSEAPVLYRAGSRGDPLIGALLPRPRIEYKTMPIFAAMMESRRLASL